MKVALVNPPWSFRGSIYFGCREGHLPLELGYAKALLERDGHDVLLVDAQLGFAWRTGATALNESPAGASITSDAAIRAVLTKFGPDATAITTAPSYLFWRCAPPELRVPMQTLDAIREVAGTTIAIGPHASTTPGATLKKLRVDVTITGECEEVVAALAQTPRERWNDMPWIARLEDGKLTTTGARRATDMKALPALRWPAAALTRHAHHHHRFDREPEGPGAEIEASRGCPYHCTFCAKDNYRDEFRKRPLPTVLDELDGLLAAGVRYVYFIDEIFVPDRALLEALCARDVAFGVQLRIDNWSPAMLELLGRAGCVSIEGGIESITERGRSLLAKHCKLTTEELTERFFIAKEHVPFVQANLLDATTDEKKDVAAWRERLRERGVWANEPVPMFPYPGSPEYTLRFGACDDSAWERAHAHYLAQYGAFSDIQDAAPIPLAELESRHG
jgi:B12-binding domain/radical SAM domain protein of rhizo-twelve system